MEMGTKDYLKKALLDTQEKVRDFMTYSRNIDNKELKSFFKESAEIEGEQANRIQKYIEDIEQYN